MLNSKFDSYHGEHLEWSLHGSKAAPVVHNLGPGSLTSHWHLPHALRQPSKPVNSWETRKHDRHTKKSVIGRMESNHRPGCLCIRPSKHPRVVDGCPLLGYCPKNQAIYGSTAVSIANGTHASRFLETRTHKRALLSALWCEIQTQRALQDNFTRLASRAS